MSAWSELSSAEYDDVWDRFDARFGFRAGIGPEDWPGIREPRPSITYAIPPPWPAEEISELHHAALAAFRLCVPPAGRIYALDWQHTCHWFAPHRPMDEWERPDPAQRGLLPGQASRAEDRWLVPVLPNGDYYVFLAPALDWGWFGHPWEQSICVFGEQLLTALARRPPSLFRRLLRRA